VLDAAVVPAPRLRVGASDAIRGGDVLAARPLPRWLGFRPLLLAAAVLSALSLLVFRTPTFDVWAWLLWGREAAHLNMDTTWGPAFKPLPVAVATVLSPLGGGLPAAWLFLARLGGLLAVGAAARLAYRNAGAPAAAVAAVGLLLVRQYAGYLLPHGMSEPMMVAFLLWALDRAEVGRRESAFWLGVIAGLLRPEIWPFLLGYALLLMRGRSWGYRLGHLAGLVALPIAWYLPDYLGSGEPFRAGEGVPVPGGPLTQATPALAVLRQTIADVPTVVLLGAALGLLVAILARSRRLVGYAALGAGWIVLVAVMAQTGQSTGVSRYVLPTYALLAVLAGVGWSAVISTLLRRPRLPDRLALGAAAAVVLGLVVVATEVPALLQGSSDEVRELRYQAGLQHGLQRAVDDAGGASKVRACGRTWTAQYQVPFVAWTLHERVEDVWSLQAPGLPEPAYVGPLLQTKDRRDAPLEPVPFDFLPYRLGGGATSSGATWTIMLPADCS
jgi:hypothetical protein